MKIVTTVIFFILIIISANSGCISPSGNGLNACALSGIQITTSGFNGANASIVTNATSQWNNCNNLGGSTIPDFNTTGKASIFITINPGNAPDGTVANWVNDGSSGTITLYANSSSGSPYSSSELEYHLAHELGHALGLGDVNDRDCLMHQNNNSRRTSVSTGDCTSTGSLWDRVLNIPDNDDCVNQLKTYGDCNSPIVIDMNRDGFAFGDNGVYFDLLGVGRMSHIQWVVPNGDDSFLVHDIDADGKVDNGSELFGNGTRLILQDNKLAKNGFEGLAQWDLQQLGGNENGVIDPDDAIWSLLLLWQDRNADGVSQDSEIIHLSEIGLTRLSLKYKDTGLIDAHGNILRFWGKAFKDSGPAHKFSMVDVFFKPATE